MTTSDFTTTILVDQTSEEVFDAVNNVRGWWSEDVKESTSKVNNEFVYRHKDLHYSKQKLIEVIPNKKVVWLITDSMLSFAENKTEWTGTKVLFEISRQGDKTKLLFTHEGLVPQCDCFEACSGGWTYYLHKSLLPLITKGEGNPDNKENKVVENISAD
jgi:hypothetical protein